GNLHTFASCLNVGERGSIVLGIAMTARGDRIPSSSRPGLDGSELTGSGKPVTPCERMQSANLIPWATPPSSAVVCGLLEDPHAAIVTRHAVAARVIQAPLSPPLTSGRVAA